MRVFLDQVRRSRPDYTLTDSDASLVAGICRQLDGLPRALRAAASWLVVYDMPTLHECLHDGDPATLLEHLAGADGGYRLQDTLVRRVRQLPGENRILLDELCDWDEEFTLADVVDLTGLSLPDSARLVHALVTDGIVVCRPPRRPVAFPGAERGPRVRPHGPRPAARPDLRQAS